MASRWVRMAGAIALSFAWVGVGTATDIVSPANVKATSNPFLALVQDGIVGSIPAYQWALEGNQIEFSIHDLGGGAFPLQINAGANSNSIRIGNDRNVGFGISTPQRNLHIVDDDDPPTLRFQNQFQVWDIEADSLGFDLVNDPGTTSETRPFTVLPDAPTASLFVATNGSIGVGTATPQVIGNAAAVGRLFNVRSDASNSRFVLQGQQGGLMEVVDLSAAANRKIFRMFSRSGFARFQVVRDDLSAIAVNNVLAIDMSNGNLGLRVAAPLHPLHLASGARCTAGGVFTNASSRALKQDITPLTSEQARETVRALQPVGFRYKHELDERYVGFIAEDVPELVATRDRKSLAPMDITAVLTKVVQDQDRLLVEQQTEIVQQRGLIAKQEQLNAQQQETLAALMRRLADLEQKMGDR